MYFETRRREIDCECECYSIRITTSWAGKSNSFTASLKSERLGNETLSTLLGRPSHSLVWTLPPMPPLPLAASCAHLFIPELVLKRRPRQLPEACASHWQCEPNDCGLPVLGTDASTEAAAAAAAPTEATCARHRRHATVSSASLRSLGIYECSLHGAFPI